MTNVPRPKVIVGSTVTRPADTTAYASGDLVANSTTAGSVTPHTFANVVRAPGYRARITRAGLKLSGTAVTNGTFRLHLFSAAPTVANGDNAALAIATNNASYLGYIEIVLAAGGAGGAVGWSTAGVGLAWLAGNGTTLWGLVEARAAYTPISAETIIPSIEVDQY